MKLRPPSLLAVLVLLACLNTPAVAAETVQNNTQAATPSPVPVIVLAWQRVGSPLRMDA
jgi:hypothetical protein